ncbi:MAG: monovalent cation/H(+) antiporter subunit G [Deltaproteobacteria bacterium]|nr:monovalent cation/H(+) antiporter subunit G [Deltaproteobacteria bacterium]
MELAASLLMLAGSIFFFVSSIGIVRMPDIYNRIQAGTKATTMGSILMLAGVGIVHSDWWPKLIVALLFVLLTNPISSHVVARSAHYTKEEKTDRTVSDKLEEDFNETQEGEA